MSSVMIDTQVLVWALYGSSRLGKLAIDIMTNADSVYVSLASLWELSIKHSSGKFPSSAEDLVQGAKDLGVIIMPLTTQPILCLSKVLIEQKDPFDRLIVAQSISENIKLLTSDRLILRDYPDSIDATK